VEGETQKKMKKLFITGPRAIVSAFLLRNIEKGYSTEEIKDDGEKATVVMKESANDNE
jgi:hypothetical protein